MHFNPNALVFWAFCAILGFLLGGLTGTLVALIVGFGISLLASEY